MGDTAGGGKPMRVPVLVDVVVGLGGEKIAWRVETMAEVVPHDFAEAMKQLLYELLWPETAAEAVDTPPETSEPVSGAARLGVSDGGAAVESSRAAAPKSPRRAAPTPTPRGVSRVHDRLAAKGLAS